MIEPIGWITALALITYLLIMVMQWWTKINDAKQRRKDEIDKDIEVADSFDAFVRINDELRSK